MEKAARCLYASTSPEELLGRPLNEIEQKFAPQSNNLALCRSISFFSSSRALGSVIA
jgi:hypothetical protein